MAFHGARVLHPASIAPAVKRRIPVRVVNSLRPQGPGTIIQEGLDESKTGLASFTSRRPVHVVRVRSRRLSIDPTFVSDVIAAYRRHGGTPELVVSSEVAVALVDSSSVDAAERIAEELADRVEVDSLPDRAMVCAVGQGLASGSTRERVLAALSGCEPDLLALGASRTSLAAVIDGPRLEPTLRRLHRDFFESGPEGDSAAAAPRGGRS